MGPVIPSIPAECLGKIAPWDPTNKNEPNYQWPHVSYSGLPYHILSCSFGKIRKEGMGEFRT